MGVGISKGRVLAGCLVVISATTTLAAGCKAPPSQNDQEFFWRKADGPNGERNPGAIALYTAVIQQDREEVFRLLKSGTSPNSLLSRDGWSTLMLAAAEGDIKMASILLKNGADINYVRSDPVDFSALAVALNYAIPSQNFSTFQYLLSAGADVNASYVDHGDAVFRDPNGDAFTGQDIAKDAATLGQIQIVNELLARGYRRDLPGLLVVLKIIVVNDAAQPAKDRAIATVTNILGEAKYREQIPKLLENLRAIISNQQEEPWLPNSPHKDPEKDAEVIKLEHLIHNDPE